MDLDLDWVDGRIDNFEEDVCDAVLLSAIEDEDYELEGTCVYEDSDCFVMRGGDGYMIVFSEGPITVDRVDALINRIVGPDRHLV